MHVAHLVNHFLLFCNRKDDHTAMMSRMVCHTESPRAGLTSGAHFTELKLLSITRSVGASPVAQWLVKKAAQESNKHIITDDATTTPTQHNMNVAKRLEDVLLCFAQHELSL